MMKFHLQWHYKTKNNKHLLFTSDEVDIYNVLLYVEDIEKTGRVRELQILDRDDRQWSKKEIKRVLSKVEDEPTRVSIYFDGGFDKEDRIAGLGAVVYYTINNKRHRMRINEKVRQIKDNNEAEYAALQLGIRTIMDLGVEKQEVTIYGDSKVVISEMSGDWICYDEVLNHYGNNIDKMLEKSKITCQYMLIDRKENEEAHGLATQALKDIVIQSKKEVDDE